MKDLFSCINKCTHGPGYWLSGLPFWAAGESSGQLFYGGAKVSRAMGWVSSSLATTWINQVPSGSRARASREEAQKCIHVPLRFYLTRQRHKRHKAAAVFSRVSSVVLPGGAGAAAARRSYSGNAVELWVHRVCNLRKNPEQGRTNLDFLIEVPIRLFTARVWFECWLSQSFVTVLVLFSYQYCSYRILWFNANHLGTDRLLQRSAFWIAAVHATYTFGINAALPRAKNGEQKKNF